MIADTVWFHGEPLLEHLRRERSLFPDWKVLSGAVRVCGPETTLSRVQHLLPALGITRVGLIDGLDCIGLPVAVCYRPNSRHLSSAQGKGVSRELAIASAVMECIEGYHMEQPRPSVLRAAYHGICSTYQAIDPSSLAPGYFDSRSVRNLVFDWSQTTNLVDASDTLVPSCLLTLDYSILIPETNLLSITSNGVASGNCLSEAICHGILEVVERHSLSKWAALSSAQRDETRIDLSSIPHGPVRELIDRFRLAGIDLTLWDMTVEGLGIAAINCAGGSSIGAHGGSGAHFSRDIAILRALTELAQARAVWISGSRDDLYRDKYTKQQSRRFVRPADGRRLYHDICDDSYMRHFGEVLTEFGQRLAKCGYRQILVANHTMFEFNVPVVQVIIPGMAMRHDR
jgi:ribosomal protein S12 methylthiotransferase accessory factor